MVKILIQITTLGETQLQIWGLDYLYTGELDSENKPCGIGIAVKLKNKIDRYIGTFYNGLLHGICKFSQILISLSFKNRCLCLQRR